MFLKSKKIFAVLVFFGLCASTAYPLSEKGARNWALASGLVPGAAAFALSSGLSGTKIDNAKSFFTNRHFYIAAVAWFLSAKIIHRYLNQYTPAPTLERVQDIIDAVSNDSQFAQSLSTMKQDEIVRKITAEYGSSLEDILKKFDKFENQMKEAEKSLKNIKGDLDRDELKKQYKKVNKNANDLIAYLNLRVTLITVSFATVNKFLLTEFRNYEEFGTNGTPSISTVESDLKKLAGHIENTENLLKSLEIKHHKNKDLKKSIYSPEELKKVVKFLRSLTTLRLAQVEAFGTEKEFSRHAVFSRCFRTEDEIYMTLNAYSVTSWPLVTAKQDLNGSLRSLKESHQKAYQIFNSFDQTQPDYKQQSYVLLDKLQTLISLVESNLALIVRCRDYNYQVGLFEKHQEMERQRKLKEERIRRQEEMERQRLEQERILHRERIMHEQNMAREKKRQENEKAERQRQHERELLENKLEHDRQMKQEKSTSTKSNSTGQTSCIGAFHSTTTATTPTQAETSSQPPYIIEPSAPPLEEDEPPSYESLYPKTNTYPSDDQLPSFESLYPTGTSTQNTYSKGDQPPSYESLYPEPSAPPLYE